MQGIQFSKFANMSAAAFCLLAVAMFLIPSGQAGAQALAAAVVDPAPMPPAGYVVLTNHMPKKVFNGTAQLVNHYNPEQKLRLTLGIQVPHLAAEEKFISELTTKGSPNFHKFMTSEEWNARFAPSAEDEQKVVDWAQSQGLTVTLRYPNRLLVDVEGTAGTIEKAFGVTINNYQVGDEVDFSNDRDPVIPSHLSGILQSVAGLDNIERIHRIGSKYKTVKGPDYVPGPVVNVGESAHGDGDPTKAPNFSSSAQLSGPLSNQTLSDSHALDCSKNGTACAADPSSIQSSEGYNFNGLQRFSHCCNVHNDSGGSPAETSIALVGYGNFSGSDVATFFGAYGMAYNYTTYCIDGTNCPNVDGEAPLDVEYSGAMSNSYGSYLDTAHIYEYEITNGTWGAFEDAYNDVMNDDHAKVVSTSYGGSEATSGTSYTVETTTMHNIFNNMVGKGITLIAASGDNGSSDGCGDETIIDYPSSDPDFLAAGGTQLTLDSNGLYVSEIGWQGEFWTGDPFNDNTFGACANNHGGSTGGVSQIFVRPSWQNSLTIYDYYKTVSGVTTEYANKGSNQRLVPDIALTANPDVMGQWYYSGGSWQGEGGTSIVAPELAGFFAQYNTYLNYIGNICGSNGTTACTPVGIPGQFIYDAGLVTESHNPYYDMLSGCSSNNVTVQDDLIFYCAAPGFDLVTGWGSANMMQLAWDISFQLIPAYGGVDINFSGPTTGKWFNTDQEVGWTVSSVNTRAGTSFTPPGIAGFTQGWDSIPADPYSEPHSGEGNSFYSGPYYAFATSGCLSIQGKGGCSYISSTAQGCHTTWVEGWDNQGDTTTQSYGPVCVDTVDPTISSSTNPTTGYSTWVNKNVTVTLTPTDPGGSNASGIKNTYFAINSTTCTPSALSKCSVYTGPFDMAGSQQSWIYYFTEDNAGNFSSEPYIWVSIDYTTPVTTATPSGTVYSGSTYDSAVSITLSAVDSGGSGIAHTYYTLDGGSTTTYSGAINVTSLGSHTLHYWSVNGAGTTESTHTWSFTIESKTTTTLTAAPSPAVVGSPVTLKATVDATITGTPTGTVTFWDGSTSLGSATLSGGVATFVTTSLPSGTQYLKASYSGASNDYFASSGLATLLVKRTQTITFTAPTTPVRYGVAPITLSASASSKLPVVFTVTGPGTLEGTTVKINGVGTVVIKANQVGDTGYAAAPEVTREIVVDKAQLKVIATSTTVAIDQTIPKLTYTITGFVNGDTDKVVSGAPGETTTAKDGSAAGKYPITLTVGSLSAANYGGWILENGTLTITAASSAPTPPSNNGR